MKINHEVEPNLKEAILEVEKKLESVVGETVASVELDQDAEVTLIFQSGKKCKFSLLDAENVSIRPVSIE